MAWGDINRIWATIRTYDLVIIVSLLWFMVQFLRFVFPPLFETFQGIYGISNAQTGLLFTVIMLAYSTVQFPAGVLGDRLGRPFVILLGTTVFTCAAVAVAASPNYQILLGAAALIGFTTGPHKAVAIPMLSHQYPDSTGRTLGIMDTVGQFGGMVAPLVVVVFLTTFVWQGVFILGAVLSAIFGVAFFIYVLADKELQIWGIDHSRKTTSIDSKTSYVSVFTDINMITFLLVAMLFTFAWNGLSSFFPLFLIDQKGFSEGVAGILYSLLFVASVSQTVTGDLSDRVGRLSVAGVLFILMSLGITGLVVAETRMTIAVITLLIGIGFHGFRPVRDSYLMDVIPDDIGGGTLGIVRTGMTGIGALAPAVTGYLADVAGFIIAFGLIAAATVVAGGLTLGLR